MKNTVFGILVAATFFSGVSHAEAKKENRQANCELRLVTSAGAGEIFVSMFTRTEEECLEKSDNSIEARFRASRGSVSKRGGIGPQP